MREFVTAHVHRQLKAVGVQIAEIIHTCQERETRLSTWNQLRSAFWSTYWFLALIKSEIILNFVFSLFVCLRNSYVMLGAKT